MTKKILMFALIGAMSIAVLGCDAQRREVILQGNNMQAKSADSIVQDMYQIATYKNVALTKQIVSNAIQKAADVQTTQPVDRAIIINKIKSDTNTAVNDGMQAQEHLRWLYSQYDRGLSLRDRNETYIRSQESWVGLTLDNIKETIKVSEYKVDKEPATTQPTTQPAKAK